MYLYLALALALSKSACSVPQGYQQQEQQATPSRSGPSNPEITNTYGQNNDEMPTECHMFAPLVAPAMLSAVCSLHMTPLAAGMKPSISTECFADLTGMGGAFNTLELQGNRVTYGAQMESTTTWGDGYGQQQQATPSAGAREEEGYGQQQQPTPTPSEQGNGYGQQQQPTPSEQGNGYGAQVAPTPSSGGGYGDD